MFTLPRKKLWVVLLLVLIVGATLFTFFRLGKCPLADYDEAIYAPIVQNILAHGNWMTLQYSGANWFEKPPLYIWLVAASIKLLGVSEFAFRFPSALFNILAVAFLYLVVWELSEDAWLSFFSGASLLAVAPFFYFARQVRMDVAVIATILFAVWCFLKGSKLSQEKYLIGVGIGIGVGIMIKSVIGLLAIIPILIWSALSKKCDWTRNKYFLKGLCLMVLIAFLWPLYETIHYGSAFWQSYLVQQVFNRGTQSPGDQPLTSLDYFKGLWYQAQPWTILFLLSLTSLIFLKKDDPKKKIAWFGFGTTIVFFGLFFAARTKIFTYLLPMFPFALIFIAAAVFGLVDLLPTRFKKVALSLVCAGILAFAFWNTINTTFIQLPQYFSYLSDEKAVGVILGSQSSQKGIYLYDWGQNETITFYSGKEIISIKTPEELPATSGFLIVPSADLGVLAATRPFHRAVRFMYEGPALTLYETR